MADKKQNSFASDWAIIILALLVASISVFLIIFSGIMYNRWLNKEVPQYTKKTTGSIDVTAISDYSDMGEPPLNEDIEEANDSSLEIYSNEENVQDEGPARTSIGSHPNANELVDLSDGKIPSSWPGISAYNEEDARYFLQWMNDNYPFEPGWYLGYNCGMTKTNSGFFDMPMGESKIYGLQHGAFSTEEIDCVSYNYYCTELKAQVFILVSPDGRALLQYAGEDPTTRALIYISDTRIR